MIIILILLIIPDLKILRALRVQRKRFFKSNDEFELEEVYFYLKYDKILKYSGIENIQQLINELIRTRTYPGLIHNRLYPVLTRVILNMKELHSKNVYKY
jgi:hypothetical protein